MHKPRQHHFFYAETYLSTCVHILHLIIFTARVDFASAIALVSCELPSFKLTTVSSAFCSTVFSTSPCCSTIICISMNSWCNSYISTVIQRTHSYSWTQNIQQWSFRCVWYRHVLSELLITLPSIVLVDWHSSVTEQTLEVYHRHQWYRLLHLGWHQV